MIQTNLLRLEQLQPPDAYPGDEWAREMLRRWVFLPYRQLFKHPEQAAELFLSNYKFTNGSNFSSLGAFLQEPVTFYSEDNFLAGVRYLREESAMLNVECGRLDPLVLSCGHDFNSADVLRATRFVEGTLNESRRLDHFSTPVAAGDTVLQLVLNAIGFRMADTIQGYCIDFSRTAAFDTDPCIRPAREEDVPALAEISRTCFSNRVHNINRFNSDLRFDSAAVGNLYAEWIRAAIMERGMDLVLVYDDGEVSGYMTFKKPTDYEKTLGLNMGRAILSAVDPGSHKRGIYTGLLKAGCNWLRDHGAAQIEGRTQLSNAPVLRVWQNLGGKLQIAYHTYHWSRP